MDKFYSIIEKYKAGLIVEDEASSRLAAVKGTYTPPENTAVDVPEEIPEEISDEIDSQMPEVWDDNTATQFIQKINENNFAGALGISINDPSLENILTPAYVQSKFKDPITNLMNAANSMAVDTTNNALAKEALEEPMEEPTAPIQPVNDPTQSTIQQNIAPKQDETNPAVESVKTGLTPILNDVSQYIDKINSIMSDQNMTQMAINLKNLVLKHPVEFKKLADMAKSSNWKQELLNLSENLKNGVNESLQPKFNEKFDIILNEYIILNNNMVLNEGGAVRTAGRGIWRWFSKPGTVQRSKKAVEVWARVKRARAAISSARTVLNQTKIELELAKKARAAIPKGRKYKKAAEAAEKNIAAITTRLATAERKLATVLKDHKKYVRLLKIVKPSKMKLFGTVAVGAALYGLSKSVITSITNIMGFIFQRAITMPLLIFLEVLSYLKEYKDFLLGIFLPVQIISGVIIKSGGQPGQFTGPMMQELLKKITDFGTRLITSFGKLIGLDKLINNMQNTGKGLTQNVSNAFSDMTSVAKVGAID